MDRTVEQPLRIGILGAANIAHPLKGAYLPFEQFVDHVRI
jgi:hypothetical protein